MWGNRLGWCISAVIAIGAIAFGWWVWAQLAATAPTELSLDPHNTEPLPQVPRLSATSPGDAGTVYRQAMEAYAADTAACDDFARAPGDKPPRAMGLAMSGQSLGSVTVFEDNPEEIVNYDADHRPLENLYELGRTMDRAGEMLRIGGKPEKARGYFEAVYALGQGLYTERLNYDEYLKGVGLMNEATAGLVECEKAGSSQQPLLVQRGADLTEYDKTRVQPIYEVLSSADQQSIAIHAGDVFRIAETAQERMFRVEAILKVGRYRFDAARKGDQVAAPRMLKKLTSESDPVIRAAAQAGLALTIEQYRTIH